MLAVLRVAPLLPSPTLRAVASSRQVGTGKQALWSNRKAAFGVALTWLPPWCIFTPARRCIFSPALTPPSLNRSWWPARA